jgi:hypothetical protein
MQAVGDAIDHPANAGFPTSDHQRLLFVDLHHDTASFIVATVARSVGIGQIEANLIDLLLEARQGGFDFADRKRSFFFGQLDAVRTKTNFHGSSSRLPVNQTIPSVRPQMIDGSSHLPQNGRN